MNLFTHISSLYQQAFAETSMTPAFFIAFSGGADSTALLHLFVQLRDKFPDITLRAIHVNHGLNPHADSWQTHCEQLCARLKVRLIIERVEVLDTGVGVEAAARNARYGAIVQHIHPEECVVTGQHIEDQAETVLLNLKRGTGVHGLSAMKQWSTGAFGLPIFRPLLTVTKSQLLQYLAAHEMSWVEDDSNLSDQFDRNFLRRQITPLFMKRWPHFQQSVLRTTQVLSEQAQLLDEIAQEDLHHLYWKWPDTAFFNEPGLKLTELKQLSPRRQHNVLRYWVKEVCGIALSQQQLAQFKAQFFDVRSDAESLIALGSHQLRLFQDGVFLIPAPESVVHHCISLKFNQKILLPNEIGTVVLAKTQHGTLRLPAQKTEITLRFGVHGQKIQLPRRAHRTKLVNWFKENQVPPWQRQRIPLLFFGDELVAVGEQLMDQRFVIDKQGQESEGQCCQFIWER